MTGHAEGLARSALEFLPRGGILSDGQWHGRHRMLIVLLLAHVPALAAVGLLGGHPPLHVIGEVGLIGMIAAAGAAVRSRVLAAVSVTVGLVVASSLLVHFTDGLIESHFHFFAMLGFIGLYHDWRPLLAAVGYVVGHHGVLGVLAPEVVYNHPAAIARPWVWAVVHAGFVLLACVGILVFWKTAEREQEQAKRYYRDLYEGERALAKRLADAERLQSELLTIVSHELRTPLTGILGYSQTLSARISELDQGAAQECAAGIERQSRRLNRLVQNLLAASGQNADGNGVGDIVATVLSVVAQLSEERETAALEVDAPAHLLVAMSRDAASLIVGNLVDNALRFSAPGTPVPISVRAEGGYAVLEVSNTAPSLDDTDLDHVFDAFTRGDSSDTRQADGLGLGLSVARQIAVLHGGSLTAEKDAGTVRFTVRLPTADGENGPWSEGPATPGVATLEPSRPRSSVDRAVAS